MVGEMYRNKELLMQISTNLQVENRFFTDTNDIGFKERHSDSSMPTPANFYPITTHAAMQDKRFKLTIITAQGIVCLYG
jgi:alpha-mannosidase II